MNTYQKPSKLQQILAENSDALLAGWFAVQQSDLVPTDAVSAGSLKKHSSEFLRALRAVVTETGSCHPDETPPWQPVRQLLAQVSREHARQGSRPSETALFVLALKKPFFDLLLPAHGTDLAALHADLWQVNYLLDRLGLYVTEVQSQERDAIIEQQREEMLELTTPVIQLWDRVLVAPLIGTLDSRRAQSVTENLLGRVLDTKSEFAIIDITGVPTVDTMVAQHLIKTTTALRLMGVKSVISGIRPQIAQTMVQLGVQLANITTRATIADAFRLSLRHLGTRITHTEREYR